MILSHVVWEGTPEIISIFGLTARWYGLLFGGAFILGYYIMQRIYKYENINPKELDTLFFYIALGSIIGARLGHCFFYEWQHTINNPLSILYIWEGGMASHGGALGIIATLFIYSKKYTYRSFLWIVDRMVIPIAIGGALIRMGNFMNSEIIGMPSSAPWAVLFANSPFYNDVPRHPAQLYEALSYTIIFVILLSIYVKKKQTVKQGYLLGLFMVLIFGTRLLLEFIKENQVAFEAHLFINMGQILSLPFIFIGLLLIFRKTQTNIVNN